MSWNLTVSSGDNPQTWDINAESPIDPLNISVENNEVHIILSVEEEAASTALAAAARAEEAKAETQALAGSALAIANASIQAKTESVAAKNLSENARDISIQKASEAGTSEANSLANKNATIQAKTDAETAANTATAQAGIATQKANEAEASEANSLANKNASLQAKTDSESASAIAVTQAGIATTKANEAATSEANSLANKNDAIQAKTDAESAATTATAQAGIATTKAGDAGTSEANSLANKNAAIEAKAIAETKAAEALASATASNAAKVIAETKAAEALNSATASNAAKVIAETKATASATSASNALASENAAELAASQIVDKIYFAGAVEGDLYRVNSAGVAIPYKPPLSFENIRHKLAPIAYPDGALVFYDDFITGSGELNGRVSPTGQIWNTINLSNSATITGVFQVKKGAAVQELDLPQDVVATIPFTSSLNGIMLEGLFGKSSFNATSLVFVVFNSVGDYIYFGISRDRIVFKRISGISTTLVTSPALNFPWDSGVNSSSIFNANLSIIKLSATQYSVGFGANGLDFGYTITDAQAINVLNSPSKIGFSGYRGYYSFGLRIIQGYRNFI